VADAVHAVVPISGSHQREAVTAHPEAPVQGAATVFVERRPIFRLHGLEVGFLLALLQLRPLEPRNLLLEHRPVLGRLEVMEDRIGQPEAVVGNPGSYAAARRGMPPVLHVPLPKLPSSGSQEVLTHEIRLGHSQGHDVLELVAESVRPAGLVKGRAGPDSARERLVEQPAVEQEVHGSVGRLDLDRAEHLVPVIPDLTEQRVAVHRAVAFDQGAGLLTILALAQQEQQLGAFPRLELQSRLESRARVQARSGLAR
jgi:hypothetical protein